MNVLTILIFVLLIAIFVGVAVLTLVLLRKNTTPTFASAAIIDALDWSNIRQIRFARSKIIIDFLNVDFFDPETLKEAGAKGILIVGDTVKFFVEGTNETNQALYQELLNHLRG